MVCKYGMGEATGGVTFDGDRSRGQYEDLSHLSEEERRLIFTEVKKLIEEGEDKARQVMVQSRAVLDRIAEELLERETLTADQLREIAGYVREPQENGSEASEDRSSDAEGSQGNGKKSPSPTPPTGSPT